MKNPIQNPNKLMKDILNKSFFIYSIFKNMPRKYNLCHKNKKASYIKVIKIL